HDPGRLGDRARPLSRGHEPGGPAALQARLALRPDPRRARTALARLAEPGHADDGAGDRGRAWSAPGVLARPQTPRLAARGARLRARVSALSGDRMADAERVPPRRVRVPAASLRILVPGRGQAAALQ